MEVTEKLKILQEERDYWNSTAMDLLERNKNLENKINKTLELLDLIINESKCPITSMSIIIDLKNYIKK